MEDAMRTVRDALRWSQGLVPADARISRYREIDRLLASILEIPTHDLRLRPERSLNSEQAERFRELWLERLRGTPLQYLLGETEFLSLTFRVTPGVFIPRPETECLVESAIAARSRPAGIWVDVGTGSGIVAIALAVHVPGLTVYATDVSTPALRLTAENARFCGVSPQVRLVRGDLLRPFREGPWADGIISNPPYIAEDEMDELPPEVRDHEPRDALFGGPDGLDLVRALIHQAPAILKPEGLLALEIGETQADGVRALLGPEAGWSGVRIEKDLAGRDRVAMAFRHP